MHHAVKCEARWLRRIVADQKHCEIRYDDRDYQVGDTLTLLDEDGRYTGIERLITHVLRGEACDGIEDGYVVLSLEDRRVADLPRLRREVDRLTRSNRSLRASARSLKGATS